MEKQALAGENDKATRSISIVRELYSSDSFKNEHRTYAKFFFCKVRLSLYSRPAR
jgi:hypothetical protein